MKRVDRAAVHASAYADRIPAATHRALHVEREDGDDAAAAWQTAVPWMALDVAQGLDTVATFTDAVRAALATPAVGEVVVVLVRLHPDSTGSTLPDLVASLWGLEHVSPIVLPAPA